MQGTRKTKNRYQQNISEYNDRILKATNDATKKRLKEKIKRFKLQIKRAEKRESVIKYLAKEIIEYYDLDMTMRELLIYNICNLNNETNKYLYLVRSMFFKACSIYGMDGLMIYNYYRIDTCTKQVFYNKKTKAIVYIDSNFKDNWIKFRNYLKQNQCSTTTPH